MDKEWICTDSDSAQYGRQVSGFIWKYRQPNINDGKPVLIDLLRYSILQVEDVINSYGYTLECNGGYKHNIYQEYGAYGAIQVMCECLFEMEEKPSI